MKNYANDYLFRINGIRKTILINILSSKHFWKIETLLNDLRNVKGLALDFSKLPAVWNLCIWYVKSGHRKVFKVIQFFNLGKGFKYQINI